jgi:site-specific DNA-methyltransferase (adenine-specific)
MWRLIPGDCFEVLRAIPTASVDAIVTDPPAAISFMGRVWDGDLGGRDQWIGWLRRIMRQCLRVLKPGGHAVVWAIARTQHWTATAIEDAGFEIRDNGWCYSGVQHLYLNGFPKSLDVSKAIDAHLGAARTIVGAGPWSSRRNTEPPEASIWQGYGTALKPAVENWVLARKPLEGTVARNVLAHGVGGLNIDGCRIRTADCLNGGAYAKHGSDRYDGYDGWRYKRKGEAGDYHQPDGRWPPHVLYVHGARCTRITKKVIENGNEVVQRTWLCEPGCPVAELDRQSGQQKSGVAAQRNRDGGVHNQVYGAYRKPPVPDATYGDTGGASRMFPVFRAHVAPDDPIAPFCYVPKAPRAERDAGCEHLPRRSAGDVTGGRTEGSAGLDSPRAGAGRTSGAFNFHPTVKPIALCRWLVRLVTPPRGTVVDPFSGSASIGCAALREGRRFIGIELDPEYALVARYRLIHWAARTAAGR